MTSPRSDLRAELERAIATFVEGVLAALGRDDWPAGARRAFREGALQRSVVRWRRHASPADLELRRTVVLEVVRELAPGFAKRDIARKSGFGVAVHGIVRELVAEGVLIKDGEGRNTRYRVR